MKNIPNPISQNNKYRQLNEVESARKLKIDELSFNYDLNAEVFSVPLSSKNITSSEMASSNRRIPPIKSFMSFR